ncbi:hypothetical protein ACFSNO_11990 [Streptomyces cirratus]
MSDTPTSASTTEDAELLRALCRELAEAADAVDEAARYASGLALGAPLPAALFGRGGRPGPPGAPCCAPSPTRRASAGPRAAGARPGPGGSPGSWPAARASPSASRSAASRPGSGPHARPTPT